MFSEAPPCSEDVVISCTCREFVLVNTLVNSGIIAPASVPQLMITDNTHQRAPRLWLPLSADGPSNHQLARKVTPIEINDVIHTKCVSGASRSKSFSLPY